MYTYLSHLRSSCEVWDTGKVISRQFINFAVTYQKKVRATTKIKKSSNILGYGLSVSCIIIYMFKTLKFFYLLVYYMSLCVQVSEHVPRHTTCGSQRLCAGVGSPTMRMVGIKFRLSVLVQAPLSNESSFWPQLHTVLPFDLAFGLRP